MKTIINAYLKTIRKKLILLRNSGNQYILSIAMITFLISKWIRIHKSNKVNEIIKNQTSEYINIIENLQIEDWPIVAEPVYYTSGISDMLHIILEPSSSFIAHILKDFLDLLEWLIITCKKTLAWFHVILNLLIQIFTMMYFTKLLNIGSKN